MLWMKLYVLPFMLCHLLVLTNIKKKEEWNFKWNHIMTKIAEVAKASWPAVGDQELGGGTCRLTASPPAAHCPAASTDALLGAGAWGARLQACCRGQELGEGAGTADTQPRLRLTACLSLPRRELAAIHQSECGGSQGCGAVLWACGGGRKGRSQGRSRVGEKSGHFPFMGRIHIGPNVSDTRIYIRTYP
jgi:hypothetical protein